MIYSKAAKDSIKDEQDDWEKYKNDTDEDDDEADQILWGLNCPQLSSDWVFDIRMPGGWREAEELDDKAGWGHLHHFLLVYYLKM